MSQSEKLTFKSKILESLADNPSPSYEGDSEVSALLSPEAISKKKFEQVQYVLKNNPELATEAGARELERQSRINASMLAAANEGIIMPPYTFDRRVRSTRRKKPGTGAS